MSRTLTVIWALVALAAGSAIYVLKEEVQDKEADLAALHRAILADQEAIRVLRAEWSYLNRPAGLEERASGHLGLVPLTAAQIASITELPEPPVNAPEPVEAVPDLPTLAAIEPEAPAPPVEPAPRAAPRRPVESAPLDSPAAVPAVVRTVSAEDAAAPASIDAILAGLRFEQ